MNPQTKSHLESRIRLLLAGAQRQCDEAHEHEDQARYLRAAAERDRCVASDIQALLDGTPLPVGELPTTTGEGHRQVQHVDTDEPEATGIPPHVWLYRNMLTDQQLVAPLGRDETNGQYAVAIDDLTDEQRAIPHVARQIDPSYTHPQGIPAREVCAGVWTPDPVFSRNTAGNEAPGLDPNEVVKVRMAINEELGIQPGMLRPGV